MIRTLVQFLGLLLLAGVIAYYWSWIVIVCAAAALIYATVDLYRAMNTQAARHAAEQATIVARADQQHAWVLEGDERGVYGADGMPAQEEYRR